MKTHARFFKKFDKKLQPTGMSEKYVVPGCTRVLLPGYEGFIAGVRGGYESISAGGTWI